MKLNKSQLIDAAIEGNEIGFNRQLEPDRLRELDDEAEWTVVMNLPHDHIGGRRGEPHMRYIFSNGASLDVTWDRHEQLEDAQ